MKHFCLSCIVPLFLASASYGETIFYFTDPSGLSGEVGFTLIAPTTLQVRAKNTSTGISPGATSADQILTSVAFDLGVPGMLAGDPAISGGMVVIGSSSLSLNFSNVVTQLGPGDNVSGEFGYGNGGTTGLHPNFISGNSAGITPFGGPNLDGPGGLNGPQAGLIASTPVVSLGGLGAIKNEWVATLTLTSAILNLNFLDNGVRIEFGSDYKFVDGIQGPPVGAVPEPASMVLLTSGILGLGFFRRKRSRTDIAQS